jgi:hypothetical protein
MTASDDELSAAERMLVSAAAVGTAVDLRVGDANLDDPAHGAQWDAGRTVRAQLLVELLTGTRTAQGGRIPAVKLYGARIIGDLDLEAAQLVCPLLLHGCHIGQPVNLNGATAPAIRLPGCHLPGLTAAHLRTTSNLELNHGFTAQGDVSLTGAQISGELDLTGARLTSPGFDGCALWADGLFVEQDMRCGGGFTARGSVVLTGCRIGGQLDLTGASLTHPDDSRLSTMLADRLTVQHDMLCRRLRVNGMVQLRSAWIGGTLDLTEANVSHWDVWALEAQGLQVRQDIRCVNFRAEGQICLAEAHIGGQVDLRRAELTNPGSGALVADRIVVERDMLCGRLRAHGEVSLVEAKVGGQLDLTGVVLTDGPSRFAVQFGLGEGDYPDRVSVNLRAAQVNELILLPARPPDGRIDLIKAKIGAFYDSTTSHAQQAGSASQAVTELLDAWDRLGRLAPNAAQRVVHLARRTGLREDAVEHLRVVRNRCAHPGGRGWPAPHELDQALATARELQRRLNARPTRTGEAHQARPSDRP